MSQIILKVPISLSLLPPLYALEIEKIVGKIFVFNKTTKKKVEMTGLANLSDAEFIQVKPERVFTILERP